MLRGVIVHLHHRPIALLAAGLIALQTFLVGLTGARAALVAADPLGVAVICHGGGSNNTDDDTAPDPIKQIHPCCFACMAGTPTATLPQQTLFLGFEPSRTSTTRSAWLVDVPTADRSIRAGQSQAPPRRG